MKKAMVIGIGPDYLESNLSGSNIKSYLYNLEGFLSGLKEVRELGFSGLDLTFWCAYLTKEEIEKIRVALLPFKQIALHATFGYGLNTTSIYPNVRKGTMDEYIATLEVAKKIGARTVTIHGGQELFLKQKEYYGLYEEAMKTLDAKARSLGVFVCWETFDAYFLPLERFARIRELSLTNTGICLDTGHVMELWTRKFLEEWEHIPLLRKGANAKSGITTFRRFLLSFRDLIWHIHINDYQKEPKGKHTWRDHHVIGGGVIEWKEFFTTLAEIGYDGILSMEIHPDSYKCSNKGILKNRDYIKKIGKACGANII